MCIGARLSKMYCPSIRFFPCCREVDFCNSYDRLIISELVSYSRKHEGTLHGLEDSFVSVVPMGQEPIKFCVL